MASPLAGKRILVTRPAGQASSLADRLQVLGAIPVLLPAIEIAPLEDYSEMDGVLGRLDQFDWVVFTSVNGVASVATRLDQLGIERSAISNLRIAVIGPVTSAAVENEFRAPDMMPNEFVSEAIAEMMRDEPGKRFLLLRADLARKNLADELRRNGCHVEEVAAYRIRFESGASLDIDEPTPDYITLTSSASVHATLAKLVAAGKEQWMMDSALACIGPITAETVSEIGYRPAVTAAEYTIPGLIAALYSHAKELSHA